MCWRLFISTRAPLAPRDEPALRLGAPGPNSESIVAGLGGHVVEAVAHTGCACGFFASYVAVWTRASRRSEIAGLEEALVHGETSKALNTLLTHEGHDAPDEIGSVSSTGSSRGSA